MFGIGFSISLPFVLMAFFFRQDCGVPEAEDQMLAHMEMVEWRKAEAGRRGREQEEDAIA